MKIPIILKINSLFDVNTLLQLEKHSQLDAVSISNSLPWKEIFPNQISPLKKFSILCFWRVRGIIKKINLKFLEKEKSNAIQMEIKKFLER